MNTLFNIRRITQSLLLFFLLFLFVQPDIYAQSSSGTLYGITVDAAKVIKVVSIDQVTGAFTDVGVLPGGAYQGISAFDPVNHRFFGGPNVLTIVDVQTGTTTTAPPFTSQVHSFEFDSSTNTLYGITVDAAKVTKVVSIDQVTGAFTDVGVLPGGAYQGISAFDPVNHRFFGGPNVLTIVDVQTGTTTTAPPFTSQVHSFEFDSSTNTLYGITVDAAKVIKVVSIDQVTGAFTDVGVLPGGAYQGISAFDPVNHRFFGGPNVLTIVDVQTGTTTTAPPFTSQVHSFEFDAPTNQPPVCDAATPSKSNLWPPNHKFATIDILDATDPEGDMVALSVDSIFQDEPVEGTGDGDTAPDGRGIGTPTVEVRAERADNGNGRIYHISFTADDGHGGTCSGAVLIGVPHDKNDIPIDDGALYDSTAGSVTSSGIRQAFQTDTNAHITYLPILRQ